MSQQAIGLLFGVKGAGRIKGDSGALIVSQLTKIVNQINNGGNGNPVPRIALKVDTSNAIAKLDDIKNQLQTIHSLAQITINLSTQAINAGGKLGGGNYSRIISDIKKYHSALREMRALKENGADVSVFGGYWSSPDKSYDKRIERINALRAEYDKLGISINAQGNIQMNSAAQLMVTAEQYDSILRMLKNTIMDTGVAREKVAQKVATDKTASEQRDNYKSLTETIKAYYAALSSIKNLVDGGNADIYQLPNGMWDTTNAYFRPRIDELNELCVKYGDLTRIIGDTSLSDSDKASALSISMEQYTKILDENTEAIKKNSIAESEATDEYQRDAIEKWQTKECEKATSLIREYYKEKQKAEAIAARSTNTNKAGGGLWATIDGGNSYAKQTVDIINSIVEELSKMGVSFDDAGAIASDSIKNINIELESQERLIEEVDSLNYASAQSSAKVSESVQRSWGKNAAKVHDYIMRNQEAAEKNYEVSRSMQHLERLANSKNPRNLDELLKKFDELQKKVRSTGADIETWGQKFKKAFGNHVRSALASIITLDAGRAVRDIYNNVVNLDKAMVNLQVASGKTKTEVRELTKQYAGLAKQLGATTIEVAESADTWLRQGYEASDANKLIENSMMLSKLGQLESAEASRALTSAMKGYGVSVEGSIGIVDRLVKVDMEAATSAGDIATAMAETATSAKLSGVSMDKLIGYITTVKEVTQDGAESVGNFYKALFARVGKVQAGASIDDEGESLNNVERVLESLGIKLRDSENNFRNIGDVLDEVGAKWDSYNNVVQHQIATEFAGTRQQEKFLTLLNNYSSALNYAEISAGAAGTAVQKYGDYLNGVESSTNALQAEIESLSMTLLDSKMITDVVGFLGDAVRLIENIVQKMGGLKGVLIATLSITMALKSVKIFNSIATQITNIKGKIDTFNHALKVAKETGVGISNRIPFALKQVSGAASVAAVKVQMLASSLSLLVGAGLVIFNLMQQANEQRISDSINRSAERIEDAKTTKEKAESIGELIEKYEKLAKTSGGTWDKTTADEVRGIQDSITNLVGEQAKGIDLVNGKLEEERQKLKDIKDGQYNLSISQAKEALADAELAVFAAMDTMRVPGTDKFHYEIGSSTSDNRGNYGDIKLAAPYVDNLLDYVIFSPLRNDAIATYFRTAEEFAEQYEAVLEYKQHMIDLHAENGWKINYKEGYAFDEINDFLKDYKDVYTTYVNAKAVVDSLTAPKPTDNNDAIADTTEKIKGLTVGLKSVTSILDDVKDGYDGISKAMKNATEEGYLTADAVAELYKLDAENKFHGLSLEKYLTSDKNGYKFSGDMLSDYIEALIKAEEAEYAFAEAEGFASYQSRKNALENISNLRAVLATLILTGDAAADAAKKEQDALEKQKDAFDELIDMRKELLETYSKELDYQEELNKRTKNVEKLQTQLSIASLDNSAAGRAKVRELEKQLQEAQDELDDFTLEHAIDVITNELESQSKEHQELIKSRLEDIKVTLSGIKEANDKMAVALDKLDVLEMKIAETDVVDGSGGGGGGGDGWVARKTYSIISSRFDRVPIYHTGGLVGDITSLSSNEEFAKLLKGELVTTPPQMKRFMEETLPSIARYPNSSRGSMEINAPLVEIRCDNVTQESLPDLERIVKEAAKEIKRELDSGMSRTGYKGRIKRFTS